LLKYEFFVLIFLWQHSYFNTWF